MTNDDNEKTPHDEGMRKSGSRNSQLARSSPDFVAVRFWQSLFGLASSLVIGHFSSFVIRHSSFVILQTGETLK